MGITPFIELSRKVLIISEESNKTNLVRSLKFYSFAYAYLSLQLQTKAHSTQMERQLTKLKNEMKDKLISTSNLLEIIHKDGLVNDQKLALNYANALLQTGKEYKVNFAYTDSEIQNDIFNYIAEKYQLEKGKDIQLEASLFGLPGVDIYLDKCKLAIEVDGRHHYRGAENKAIKGLALIQKAIFQMNNIELIHIQELHRKKDQILQDIELQIDDLLRKQGRPLFKK